MAILGRIPRDDSALRGVQSFMDAFMQSKRLQLKQENIDFARTRIKEQDTFDREDRERKVKEKGFLADFIFNTEQSLVDDRNKARFEEKKAFFKKEEISFKKEEIRGLPSNILNIIAKGQIEAPEKSKSFLLNFLKFKQQTKFKKRELTIREETAEFQRIPTNIEQKALQLEAQGKFKEAAQIRKEKVLRDISEKTSGVRFKNTSSLRKEFTKLSDSFISIRDSFDRIKASIKDPSAAGDLALIFNFMKMLDPKSVVRESEFRVAETSSAFLTEQGVPTFILRLRAKLFAPGGRLAPGQRIDMIKKAREIFDAQERQQNIRDKEFTRIAIENNLNPKNVVINIRPPLGDIPIEVKKSTSKRAQMLHKIEEEIDKILEGE